jgi:hypothetical protein
VRDVGDWLRGLHQALTSHRDSPQVSGAIVQLSIIWSPPQPHMWVVFGVVVGNIGYTLGLHLLSSPWEPGPLLSHGTSPCREPAP